MIKNKDGYIVAYLEYFIFDKEGNQVEDGEYGYVNDVWVHDRYRNNGVLRHFIQHVIPKLKIKYLYWLRRKYDDRRSVFDISRGKRIKLRRHHGQ